MSDKEIQEIILQVLEALRSNSLTVDELLHVNVLKGEDCVELNKGRKTSLSSIKSYLQQNDERCIDVLKKGDVDAPSDTNVFSALRTLLEIANNNEVFKKLFLRKDQPDFTNYLLTLLGGLNVGDFIDSMTAGKGAGIDALGNGQFESLEVRSYLKVMELVYNRLSALEGDFVFTESGTIDLVEDLGESTYRLTMRKRWDADFTALDVDDILRATVNNLTSTGEYFTGWYRVLSKNSVSNTITVVLYSNSECPAGLNFAPTVGMMAHRWGNTNPEKAERQRCWYMSSVEGRIVWLTGVNKPIVDDDNYSTFYGLPVKLKIFDGKPINYNNPYLYLRGLIVQDIIKVDWQGNIQYEIVDRALWSAETACGESPYLFEVYNETTGRYETHDVWRHSCRYRCLKNKTIQEPRWNAADWDEISGDPTLRIVFDMPNGDSFYGPIDCPVYVHVYRGVTDVTGDVLDEDIEWYRTTSDPLSDQAWNAAHGSSKKFLHVTDIDCGTSFETDLVCKFTCIAFVRDGVGNLSKVEDFIPI